METSDSSIACCYLCSRKCTSFYDEKRFLCRICFVLRKVEDAVDAVVKPLLDLDAGVDDGDMWLAKREAQRKLAWLQFRKEAMERHDEFQLRALRFAMPEYEWDLNEAIYNRRPVQ